MSLLQRFTREPNAIVGVIVAAFGLLVIFDLINPTPEQTGGLAAFGGAIIVALRWLVTPASEVVAQRRPGEPTVTGPGASVNTGIPVDVVVKHTERGATSTEAVAVTLVLLFAALLLALAVVQPWV